MNICIIIYVIVLFFFLKLFFTKYILHYIYDWLNEL